MLILIKYIYIITMRNYIASNRILKYAFSILKQPAGHSSIEKTVFSIESLYAYVNRIYIYIYIYVIILKILQIL